MKMIHKLIQSLSGAQEPKILLDKILDAAVTFTGATTGSIILIDKATEELSIEAARGLADRIVKATRLKIGKGITGWVAEHKKVLRVDDVREDKRYVSLSKNIKSELAAPLILDDEVIGVINVDSTKISAFNDDDSFAIETLATLSSRVIADALIHDRLKRRSKQLETLVRIGSNLASIVSVDKILEQVTSAAADLIRARLVAVRLLDEKGENLILAAKHGGSAAYSKLPPVPVKGSVLGSVAETRIPLIIEDVLKETEYKFKNVARKEKLASMLAVPLNTSEKSLGVLVIYRDKPGDFEDDAVTIAVGLAGLTAAALQNAELFRRVIDAEKRTRLIEMKATAREMGAGLAHQIRNPLTVVRLLVGAKEQMKNMDDSDRTVALRELQRIDELISALLNNAGEEQSRYEDFDLDSLIDEILSVAKIKASSKDVSIEVKGRAEIIRGVRNQIWQVIAILIDNAVEAAQSRVMISCIKLRNGRIELSFDDDGAGVKTGIKIFEPFVSTKMNGAGIGLYTARRIVLEHGGTIEYKRSLKLGGASFSVVLPGIE